MHRSSIPTPNTRAARSRRRSIPSTRWRSLRPTSRPSGCMVTRMNATIRRWAGPGSFQINSDIPATWSFLVVVGVSLEVVFVVWEYVEELHDFRRGVVHPPERPIRLLFFLGLLGAALVAIGVAGELYAESKIETVETGIRKANDELFLLLSKEAGDAEKSAKAAHEEADAVKKETDVLTLRLENASRQLGKLEKNIAVQGPRAQLIIKAAPELARKLAPFAGQRVGLFVCGQQGLVDQETLDAWGAIANILGPDTVSGVTGAKWKEVPTNLNFAGNCGAAKGLGQGVG